MSRIDTPATIQVAPVAAQPLLEGVQKQLGSVPNMFRLIANSPAALEGYLALSGALGKGRLNPRTRAGIALTVAEANGCAYCLSAHSYLGRNLAKLDDAEINANRNAASADLKEDAALKFAMRVVSERGHVSEKDVLALKAVGYDDEQVVEIVVHVALNTLTNYVNTALATVLDFPPVSPTVARDGLSSRS